MSYDSERVDDELKRRVKNEEEMINGCCFSFLDYLRHVCRQACNRDSTNAKQKR